MSTSVWDTDLLSLPLYIPLTVVAVALLYWYGTTTFDTFKKMGVPVSGYPLPFIGNLHTMFTQSVAELDREATKKYGKIYGSYQGSTPILFVNEAEAIKQITVKDFQKFTNRRPLLIDFDDSVFRHFLTVLNDDHWKHMRNLLTPTFTSGKLKSMYQAINTCADKFVSHLAKSKTDTVSIKEYTSGYTMDVIARTAFGLDLGIQEETNHPFVAHAGTFFGIQRNPKFWSPLKFTVDIAVLLLMPHYFKMLYARTVGFSFVDQESQEYLSDVVHRVIKERSEANADSHRPPENDFLSMLVNKVIDLKTVDPDSVRVSDGKQWSTEGITEKELLSNAIIFLTAGYDTTATALQFFLYNMAIYPEIQDQLYEEILSLDSDEVAYEQISKLEYLDCCIHESLRINPPISRFDRVSSEDVTLNGLHVPKGTVINVNTYSVHYDPEYWPDPYTFSPERFLPENRSPLYQYTWLPFGAGGRNCIAMRLALLELKVAAVKLLRQFEITKTSQTVKPEDIEYVKASTFSQTKKPLRVGLKLRSEKQD